MISSRHYPMRVSYGFSSLILAFLLGIALLNIGIAPNALAAEEAPWWPIQVRSYYGTYDAQRKVPGQAAASLIGPTLEEWSPPAKANRPYNIGVAIPHLKDSYWLAVNYGIMDEARRLGVSVRLVEAGGYNELDKQVGQVGQLQRLGMDGVILGAISYTGNDSIVAVIDQRGVPVVEVINDIHAPHIKAKALVSFYDMGFYAGKFVTEQAEVNKLENLSISFLPGPKDSGWAPDSLEGFRDAITIFPGKAEIVDIQWGDTGAKVQTKRIRDTLLAHPEVNFLVGNAVAAENAPGVLEELGRDDITVVATYIIPPLYELISQGKVAAAPSDLTVYQGRMALNMMVRILNGEIPGKDFPFRSGPFIPVITQDNLEDYPFETLFGPRGYEPVFEISPK